jgi:hypothetical protein
LHYRGLLLDAELFDEDRQNGSIVTPTAVCERSQETYCEVFASNSSHSSQSMSLRRAEAVPFSLSGSPRTSDCSRAHCRDDEHSSSEQHRRSSNLRSQSVSSGECTSVCRDSLAHCPARELGFLFSPPSRPVLTVLQPRSVVTLSPLSPHKQSSKSSQSRVRCYIRLVGDKDPWDPERDLRA